MRRHLSLITIASTVCLANAFTEPPTLTLDRLEHQVQLSWTASPRILGSAKIHPSYQLQTSVDLSAWNTLEETWISDAEDESNTIKASLDHDDVSGFFRLSESFSGVDVDLSKADLTGVDLRGWDLRNADLSGAILADADLQDADLRGADLRGANLQGSTIAKARTDSSTNLLTSKGYDAPTEEDPNVDPGGPFIDWPDADGFLGNPAADFGGGGNLFGGGAAAPNFSGDNLGFAVGGSKDINNFRDNVEHDKLPLVTDVVYEGLFFDYFFNRGQSQACEDLFCPSFSQAVSTDPFSNKPEHYLSVGLNSNIKASDFQRKQLNVVIVLDVSGSMGSSFDRYYYDDAGLQQELSVDDLAKSKMDVAKESVIALLDQLKPNDQLGIVLFSSSATTFLDLQRFGDMNAEILSERIRNLPKGGGTNMSAGYSLGASMLDHALETDPLEIENRIIFLTDAQPNRGELSENGLLWMTKRSAEKRVHTSFVGIGLDFNTELIEPITKVRGANYFSVHSPEQFRHRMEKGFDYMVTPLVFGLEMTLESEAYEIVKVYGAPQADVTSGSLLKVDTLFPSESEGGETRGGLILLKLRQKQTAEELNQSIALSVIYEDATGAVHRSTEQVTIADDQSINGYPNTGIRKGILLARYADLVRNWIFDERLSYQLVLPCEPWVTFEDGIREPPYEIEIAPRLGQWERRSIDLFVARPYRHLFGTFLEYFHAEAEALEDPTLNQEIEILTKLSTPRNVEASDT